MKNSQKSDNVFQKETRNGEKCSLERSGSSMKALNIEVFLAFRPFFPLSFGEMMWWLSKSLRHYALRRINETSFD